MPRPSHRRRRCGFVARIAEGVERVSKESNTELSEEETGRLCKRPSDVTEKLTKLADVPAVWQLRFTSFQTARTLTRWMTVESHELTRENQDAMACLSGVMVRTLADSMLRHPVPVNECQAIQGLLEKGRGAAELVAVRSVLDVSVALEVRITLFVSS